MEITNPIRSTSAHGGWKSGFESWVKGRGRLGWYTWTRIPSEAYKKKNQHMLILLTSYAFIKTEKS